MFTIDLALGWGRMSDETVLQHIEVSQSGAAIVLNGEATSQEVIDKAVAIGHFNEDTNHRKIIIDNETQDLHRPSTDALWDALKKVNPS